MKIELLYFAGCPNHGPARELIDAAVSELGIEPEIEEIDVQDEGHAERLRFLGSPSIRVNGRDVEPGAESRTDYAICCRMYRASGLPARELLLAALSGKD
ncbi:MAG: DUF2703 domain-containing protein [Deltaproteobacteria bacterium]|nr:DUF2703 domain-containing protein [Deltaproteobacteria bacterium]